MVSNSLKSRLYSLFIIVLILGGLFFIPKIMMGDSVKERIPDISGGWTINVLFSQLECVPSDAINVNREIPPIDIFIKESKDKLKVAPSTLIGGDTILHSSIFNLEFTNAHNLEGNVIYTNSRGEEVSMDFLNLSLLPECNRIVGFADFIYTSEGDNSHCKGIMKVTMNKKFPTGCEICSENWTCSDWGNCNNGTQKRLCYDKNNCKDESSKPKETQSCQMPAPSPSFFENFGGLMIILLIILILGSTIAILIMEIKKGNKKKISEIKQTINKMNFFIEEGNKREAIMQYKIVKEIFEKYKSSLSERDYEILYNRIVLLFTQLSRME